MKLPIGKTMTFDSKDTITIDFPRFEKLVSKEDPIVKYIIGPEKLEYSVIDRPTKTVIVVPTQSGCKMGCTFCFLTTRKNQVVRNLSGDEISEGISTVYADEHFGSHNEMMTKDLLISFMSSGEPLNNLDGVMGTIWHWAPGDAIRFGIASIIPTVKQGMQLVSEIEKLNLSSQERLGKKVSVKLHYSMHATTDEKRKQLIPNATTISSGLSILNIYRKATGNLVEIHYTPIAGVNDTDEDIKRLGDLAKDFHVKFLTFRAGADSVSRPSSSDRVQEMKEAMIASGGSAEIYTSPGYDISAQCGGFEMPKVGEK